MGNTDEHISKLRQEAASLEVLRAKLSSDKAEFTPIALGILLEKLEDGLQDLIDKDAYDPKLGTKIAEAMERVLIQVSKIKPPTVTVTPNISLDLKPLQSIAGDISAQNKNLISVIEKNNNKGDEVYRLVLSMIASQNTFIDKMITKVNEVEKKETKVVEKFQIVRDNYGTFKEVVPVYKK
jgi:hypothetical protein